jgi:hypothetical protein
MPTATYLNVFNKNMSRQSEASRIFLYFLEFLVQHYLTKKQRTKRKYVPAKPDMWRKAPMSFFLKTELTYAYGNIFKCLQQKYVSAKRSEPNFPLFPRIPRATLSHKETKDQKEICPGEAGYVAQSAHVSN